MNTHSTYIAFDAYGAIDPVNSNLYYFRQMEVWQRDYPQRFHLLNTQEIDFSSTYNDMVDSTLKTLLIAKMQKADNVLVMASPVMNVDSIILNWQISRAVNRFHLPVIVCYAGLDAVDEDTIMQYWTWLPAKVKKYIARDSARMCHIPFTKDKIERALGAYSVRDGLYPWSSTTIF